MGAGVGAGINGTLAEFGNGLGGPSSVPCSAPASPRSYRRVGAASLPAALAAAGDADGRERISDAFASGLRTSQLVGAVAVLAGGLLAAMLLRRSDRAESPRAAE
ncbi:hypothetical protein QFZ67_003984 [Streptomyces sp. V1I1]|nr:hypothetical protein [Streptomyces sp. V1I1]